MIGLGAVAWYSVTRIALEGLRLENWQVGGIATAYFVMGAVLLATLVVAAVRLRAASPDKKQRQR
jgi:prolipoprotein diacylglyceryltransferase